MFVEQVYHGYQQTYACASTFGEIGLFGWTEWNSLVAVWLACNEFSAASRKRFPVAEIVLGGIQVVACFSGISGVSATESARFFRRIPKVWTYRCRMSNYERPLLARSVVSLGAALWLVWGKRKFSFPAEKLFSNRFPSPLCFPADFEFRRRCERAIRRAVAMRIAFVVNATAHALVTC